MKASLIINLLFVLPVLLFADYLLMIILGSICKIFEAGNAFYCGPFCYAGKIILTLTALLFIYRVFPEVKALFRSINYAKAQEV